MDYFELVEISTRHLQLNSPAAPEKIWSIGQYLGLDKSKQVIDFGCGYGRVLELWGQDFGVSGVGIDIHAYMCHQASERMDKAGLSEKIEVTSGCKSPNLRNSILRAEGLAQRTPSPAVPIQRFPQPSSRISVRGKWLLASSTRTPSWR